MEYRWCKQHWGNATTIAPSCWPSAGPSWGKPPAPCAPSHLWSRRQPSCPASLSRESTLASPSFRLHIQHGYTKKKASAMPRNDIRVPITGIIMPRHTVRALTVAKKVLELPKQRAFLLSRTHSTMKGSTKARLYQSIGFDVPTTDGACHGFCWHSNPPMGQATNRTSSSSHLQHVLSCCLFLYDQASREVSDCSR